MTNFTNPHHRLFFLHGQIDDQFCPPTLGFLDFSRMLHRHLRELGYQRIVFYNSGEQKIDTYDDESSSLIRPAGAVQEKKSRRQTKICAGKLGQVILKKSKKTPKPQTTPQLSALNNLEAVVNFNHWMNDAKHKTAIIFTNGFDFIQYFDTAAQRQMSAALNNWKHLFEENQNICIFLLSGLSIQRLREFPKLQMDWFFLLNQMFKEDNTPTSQMIPIGAPRQDEVTNILNYWRLKYNLAVDWRIFPTASAHISRYLCSNGDSLKSLSRNLRKLNNLNKEALSELAGQVEEGSALERLQQMHGLSVIAEKLERMIERHKEQIVQNAVNTKTHVTVARLLPPPPSPAKGRNLHITLKGNPGTGKTTVARLIGEIYREAGLLELGHIVKASREDLVAGYVGQTALKTSQKIADAMGGVLFVDEAYRLTEGGDNDFGKEAVETILEAMSNHIGEFAVIIAGYPQRIESFLDANPGLRRRFAGGANVLTISDYEPATLQHIFEQHVNKQERQLDKSLEDNLPNFFNNWYAERDEESFGNAGEVLNLYDEMEEQRATCVRHEKDDNHRFTLTMADVPERLRPYLKPRQPENLDTILKNLDHLVGLKTVKNTVRTMVNSIKVNRLRGDNNQLVAGHYLFVGNPGTGKTTVARLMGEIFKALGLLKKGHLVEVGRADLVGQYQGHTADKTREVLKNSMDGVLFIDEAYQLVTDERDSYGKEALETLVATMENERQRLCIIAAGYPEPMHRFVNSNPGLPSRFAGTIIFENYTVNEMLAIFKAMAAERNFILGEGVEAALLEIFQQWERGPTFGNGREVRNFLDTVCARLDNRLVEEGVTDKDLLYRIELVDVAETK